ncbi:hypothetical protein IGI04_008139 [Brassica rapa subsp. trilocularis]|uniref:Uncharacterized protein n=1 Tax=Brassica rapa subsp. trilocularis TaxID=1813537 RepID=A0ABQ7NP39_BRACM|nr:hypothetical protein IGI04_008139 [Brassica rapa subsp. trilocularis]
MPPNSVAVTMEKPDNFSLLEINGSDQSSLPDNKRKSISPKQFSWFILLKAHRVVSCLSWLFSSVRKRITFSSKHLNEEEDPKSRGKQMYRFIKACLVISIVALSIEILPLWIICYVPIFISLLNILPSPKSFPFLIPYLLFENTMSITKFNAMISGLFQLGSAYEWVVTKKTGRSSESDLLAFSEKEEKLHRRNSESGLELLSKLKEKEMNLAEQETSKKSIGGLMRSNNKMKKRNMVFKKELGLAFLLLTAAARSFLSAHGLHFYFLLFQGLSFLVVGLDLIGEQIS